MSHKFTDLNRNEWSIVITVKEYMAIKREYNIDVGAIFDDKNNWMANMLAQEDVETFLGILCECTKAQQEAKGLSEDEFFQGLGGDTLSDATDALIQGIVNFIPAHKRKALEGVIQTQKTAIEKVSEAVVMETQEAQKKVQEMTIEELLKQMNL